MANERCPSCSAAVRSDDPWCTLCWTDLRPAPPPPPAPEPAHQPVAVVASPAHAAISVGGPAVDPLTAPLPVVLGEAPAAPAAPTATWPCVECGAQNSLDLDRCGTCTAPFGGRISRLEDPKAERRKFMLYALGAVGVFLMMLALLTFAFTDTSNTDPGSSLEPTIDWSSVPREE